MERTSSLSGCHNPSEIAGKLYSLDHRLPFGEWWNDLARFRGKSLAITRWLTRYAAPRAAEFAVRSWRVRPAAVLASRTPFLLCLSRETLREGLRLLVAEWMEFRREAPDLALNLVLRARSMGSPFEFITP